MRSIAQPSRSTGADSLFADRTEAGRRLAELVEPPDGPAVVLGLPRGGIPVAAPIAARLGVGLHALAVRKIGAPGRPELAMGAVAAIGGRLEVFCNEVMLGHLGVSAQAFARQCERAEAELSTVVTRYGGAPELAGRAVFVVDDGLATGATMLAAVGALAGAGPVTITVAVPVGSRSAVATLRSQLGRVAAVVCASTPEPFVAVGLAYDDFTQVSEAEVRRLLEARRAGNS